MNAGRLTRAGFQPPPPAAVYAARREFARHHAVKLEKFLEFTLLEWACRGLDTAAFTTRKGEGDWIGKKPSIDERLADPERWGALLFAFNDPALFAFVQQITGCDPIGAFSGVVYRMMPGRHFHSWHNDLGRDRLVGFSVNLSRRGYAGGRLQIADARTETVVHEVANTGFGDAVLFELSGALVHRVSEVEPGDPKLSFAGWFVRQPDYRTWLRRGSFAPAADDPHGG